MLGVSSATSAVRVREAPASRNGKGGQGPMRGGDLPKALSGCAAAEQSRAGPMASSLWMPQLTTARQDQCQQRVHDALPDRTGPGCQDAWNSQSISQTSWKYGQEPMQMATEGWSGLQVFAWRWVNAGADVEWDVYSPHLSCVRLSLHEKGMGLSKYALSFLDSVPSPEISSLLLKREFCLEIRRWRFLEGLFVYGNKM